MLFGEFEPFYVAPKVQLFGSPTAGLSLGTLLFLFDDEQVGIAYGVGTFGSTDKAVTLGLGFGYSGDDFSSQPVAMIGGETRVSRRIKLITEKYFLPGETSAVLSGGFRFIGERFSTDVGLAGARDEGELRVLCPDGQPFLGVWQRQARDTFRKRRGVSCGVQPTLMVYTMAYTDG